MIRTRTPSRAAARAIRAAVAGGLVLAAFAGVAPASANGAAPADAATVGTAAVGATAVDTAKADGAAADQRGGKPGRPASVSGTGRISYAFSPDDEIWFTVDARADPYTRPVPGTGAADGLPTDARGTIRFSHREARTGKVYSTVGEVDCLSTGGPVATLTAMVSTPDTGGGKARIGLSILQGDGREGGRLGFSWGVANLDVGEDGQAYQPVVGTCMAPAPFAPVIRGGFDVHHTELQPRKPSGR
ncbi:hypothetical protein [Kitasatospora sp. NPDC057500]|uniref:hypothetical protein n=1 Tax=Kitasatospora sp. NPDC057500 TaxID=3346151 RepID=UPI0036CECA86